MKNDGTHTWPEGQSLSTPGMATSTSGSPVASMLPHRAPPQTPPPESTPALVEKARGPTHSMSLGQVLVGFDGSHASVQRRPRQLPSR